MTAVTDHRVVFVGAATLDAIALVDALPGPDERVPARAVRMAGGGPAATAAVAAARLGLRPQFVGAVGEDEAAEQILAGLGREGVDVSAVEHHAGHGSAASVVVADTSRGTRAICASPGPPLRLDPESPGAKAVRAATWVHVDHVGWTTVQRCLAGRGTDDRPRVSVDAGNPVPDLRLAEVDLFVPTLTALEHLYGPAGSHHPLLQAALADGAGAIVATRGADGAVGAWADGTQADVPGLAVDATSTLGAGDVFHGALLAAVARGYAPRRQLAYANAAAALSCRGLDGRSAIPSHDETVAAVADATSTDFDPRETR